MGRVDRCKHEQLEKLIKDCKVSADQIYDIDILEKFSFIEIDEACSDDVLLFMNGAVVNGRRLNVEISLPRKKNNDRNDRNERNMTRKKRETRRASRM